MQLGEITAIWLGCCHLAVLRLQHSRDDDLMYNIFDVGDGNASSSLSMAFAVGQALLFIIFYL